MPATRMSCRQVRVPVTNALAELAELLACPVCGGAVSADHELACAACGGRLPVGDGIPVLLGPGTDAVDGSSSTGPGHKAAQAAFFDAEISEEFEISRPWGAPALYGWLMEEKFRRSVSSIRATLAGATALTVCGGSGMDAELLARCGTRVIASDISIEAARRTRARAIRRGLAIRPIVADVETCHSAIVPSMSCTSMTDSITSRIHSSALRKWRAWPGARSR